ncbi:MAG: molybdopterin-dependent oxidoreductase [Candidatus Odinarchaeota archaeon]
MMNRSIINFLLLLCLFSLPLAATGFIAIKQNQITPNGDFFTNSITPPPEINATSWLLQVHGHVQSPVVFDYENFTSLPVQTEIATIKCVEGYSGTAEWLGVPLRDLLDLVQVKNGALDVVFRAADGYSSSLSMSEATEDGVLLAYEMNGEVLPVNQGFPLRIVAPGQAGYKWVMWIVEIEVVDYDYLGFWETRGWSDNASQTLFKDWILHAILFSIAFLFGGFSIVSGLKRTEWIDELKLPEIIVNVKFHYIITGLYSISATVTFIYWSIQTLLLRGTVFYSLHGLTALLSIAGIFGTVLTGLLKVKAKGMNERNSWHLKLSTFSYTFYAVTVVIGIILGLGFRSFIF